VPVPDDASIGLPTPSVSRSAFGSGSSSSTSPGSCGAHQGEGLGNRFLGHIREVDAVLHVVRCFDNPQVAHPHGETDPVGDLETVETELVLADLDAAEEKARGGGEETARR